VESFKKKISTIVENVYKEFKPDLIIFPEYSAVFLALIPFEQEIGQAETVSQAFVNIKKNNPFLKDLKTIFLKQAHMVEAVINDVFGDLACQYEFYIIGGSYFANENGELRNRGFVYGPEGKLIYTQDKVYLTPIEINSFKVSPGNFKSVNGFYIYNRKIVISICRDTFFKEWEDLFTGSDLWVDIKANGTEFNAQEKHSFEKALPARLCSSDVTYGVTVCLTGQFLELFWQGRSSIIKKTNNSIEYIGQTDHFINQEILVKEIWFE